LSKVESDRNSEEAVTAITKAPASLAKRGTGMSAKDVGTGTGTMVAFLPEVQDRCFKVKAVVKRWPLCNVLELNKRAVMTNTTEMKTMK